nr:hypothetical protein [Tanacetum cinerariifolium]
MKSVCYICRALSSNAYGRIDSRRINSDLLNHLQKETKSARYGGWWLEPSAKTPAHGTKTTPWVAFSRLAPPPLVEMVGENARCRIASDQARDTFWYKILTIYNQQADELGFNTRNKNMLTGKWTPMNRDVQKSNAIYNQTELLSDENEENLYTRVLSLFRDQNNVEFRHHEASLFLKDKYKWTNSKSTKARRTRGRVTGEDEPEMFGNDAIPRPSGAPRKSKSQRSSASSSATSGSSKNRVTEFFQEQIQLDREAKKNYWIAS